MLLLDAVDLSDYTLEELDQKSKEDEIAVQKTAVDAAKQKIK